LWRANLARLSGRIFKTITSERGRKTLDLMTICERIFDIFERELVVMLS